MTNRYAFFEGHKKSKERQYCLRAFKLSGIYSSMVHSLLKDGSNTQNILTSILFSSQLSVCIPVLRNSEWTHLYFIHRFSYLLILWTTCTCISVGVSLISYAEKSYTCTSFHTAKQLKRYIFCTCYCFTLWNIFNKSRALSRLKDLRSNVVIMSYIMNSKQWSCTMEKHLLGT